MIIDNNIDLNNLKQYMLYNIHNELNNTNTNTNNSSNSNSNTKDKNVKVSKNLLLPNYNKFNSKYNEKLKKIDFSYDKFFWCFYKLFNNLQDDDLNYLNQFKTEKEYKYAIVENIKTLKSKLQKYKIKKNLIIDELVNDNYISLETFIALIKLYDLKIILIKNNIFTYYNLSTDFYFLETNKENMLTINDLNSLNYDNVKIINIENYNNFNKNNFFKLIVIDVINNNNLTYIKNKYYYVNNIEKPLKSISAYKLDDITNMAKLLKINSFNGIKKKTKKDLYEEIYKLLL